MIVDDVVTAGTAVREAIDIIKSAGASVAGLAVLLDRQEIGRGSQSAIQEIEQVFGFPVVSLLRLDDLIDMLQESTEYGEFLQPVLAYRKKYGLDR